jgi:uncharacterized membrane protein
MSTSHDKSIQRSELLISHFLRLGVMVSGACLVLGVAGEAYVHGTSLDAFKVYSRQSFFENLQWAVLTNNRYTLITYMGLVVLVSLPVLRVFLTAILFLKQKERILAAVAMLVFIALICSFFLGIDL